MSHVVTRLLSSARSVPGRMVRRVLRDQKRRRLLARLRRHEPAPALANGQGFVLFFSPEAGVAAHFAAQCLLARTLKELGHPVLFVRCFEVFARCPVMDMHRQAYEADSGARRATCLTCGSNSIAMLDRYGLPCIDLGSLDDAGLRETLRQALAAAPHDLREFQVDGIPFGRLCIMDLVLSNKIYDFQNVDEPIRLAWRQYIASSLHSYLLLDRLCRSHTISRFVHFNDYSLLLGARLAAQKHGVPVLGVTQAAHSNIDRRRLIVVRDFHSVSVFKKGDEWPRWRDLPLPAPQVRENGADVLARLGGNGSHIFSPAKTFQEGDVRDRLGLARDRKLLVAFTSSLDERLASEAHLAALRYTRPIPPQPFADQMEWLQALIDFVGTSPELQLAIRIHPREGPHRGGMNSQHLARLRTKFNRDYPNCRFFWPQDQVSSYDLGEIADVALTSWSTIGVEMARLGVPVLACTRGLGPFPADDFIEWAPTPAAYFQTLRAMLQRPITLETITHAFRWYHFFTLATSVDFGDVVPASDFTDLPEFRLSSAARALEEIVIGGKEVLALNHARLEACQHADSVDEERRAVQQELRRVLRYLLTGADSPRDYRLLLADADGGSPAEAPGRMPAAPGPDVKVLVRDGLHVRLIEAERTWSRYSPVCSRLAPLCAHEWVSLPRKA